MNCKTTEWMYWLLATLGFLLLVHRLEGRDAGLTILGFILVWYVIVPEFLSSKR